MRGCIDVWMSKCVNLRMRGLGGHDLQIEKRMESINQTPVL